MLGGYIHTSLFFSNLAEKNLLIVKNCVAKMASLVLRKGKLRRRRHCLRKGCKGFQLVAQCCYVASFGSMFCVFHLAWSPCRATKTFVAVWRNAARWLVDLLGVDLRQVASLIKRKRATKPKFVAQSKPTLYFPQQVPSTCTNIFVAR